MDKDDIDQYAGLFRVPSKTSIGMFCWPVNITIDSMPPPVHMRVVTYSMRSDSSGDQPQPVDLANENHGELFKNSTGQKVFTFTINTKPYSVREIINLIRRHFFGEVLRGNRVRDHKNAMERMRAIEPKETSLAIDDVPVKVTDIHHRVNIRYDVELGLVDDEQILSSNVSTFNDFATLSDNECSMSNIYVSNGDLVPSARSMVESQITISQTNI